MNAEEGCIRSDVGISSTRDDLNSHTESVLYPNIQIKEEPHDDSEIMQPSMPVNNTSLIAECDPMNLLELATEQEYFDEENDLDQEMVEEEEEEQESLSGSEDSVANADKLSTLNWQQWMQDYPWLLQDDEQKNHGYCIYCDLTFSVKREYYARQHEISSRHRVYADNYIAFKNSPHFKPYFTNIKKECIDGTNSISAIKSKRKTQTEALMKFNWSRWLKEYPWLEREKNDDTTGYCTYCHTSLKVDVLDLPRHERSKNHKEAKSLYKPNHSGNAKELSETRKVSGAGNDANRNGSILSEEDEAGVNTSTENNARKSTFWCEQTENSCCCKLCNVTMIKKSLRKHLYCKMHRENLRFYKNNHPWLTADPNDSAYSYCKFCEKRLIAGFSAVKWKLHENTAEHREAEVQCKNSGRYNYENNSDNIEEQQNDSLDITNEQEKADKHQQSMEERRINRFKRGSDDWLNVYPWCKRNTKNPNYIYCLYCEIPLLLLNLKVRKHESSARHIAGEKNYLRKCSKRSYNNEYGSTQTKNTSMRTYPWLVCMKKYPDNIFCKYCRIRLARAASRSKHENSRRHQESAKAYLQKTNHTNTNSASEELVIPDLNNTSWREQFAWLSHDNDDTSSAYSYCKCCEKQIILPSYSYALKHQRSMKHIQAQDAFKLRNDHEGNRREGNANQTLAGSDQSNEYPWLVVDAKDGKKYGYCKYCKIRLMTTGILKKIHENSLNHREAVKNLSNTSQNESDSVSQVDDDADELLSVKSEPMDVDVDGSESVCNPSDVRTKAGNTKQSRQVHTRTASESAVEKAKRLTAAHAEILRLTRGKRKLDNTKNFLSSPLSIAASLTARTAASSSAAARVQTSTDTYMAYTTRPTERNTFDLFFCSVSETVKKLPSDLAAEGRIKVMQVIYDLEMRAMRRKGLVEGPAGVSTADDSSATFGVDNRSSPQRTTDVPSTTTIGYESELIKASAPNATQDEPQRNVAQQAYSKNP